MKFTAAILLAAVAQVSADASATMVLEWIKADQMVTAAFTGTTAADVASGANQEITLPTGFFCRPGFDITKANIMPAKGGTAAKMNCAAAAVDVSGAKCSDDGKKILVTAGATCAKNAATIFVQKTAIIPNANTLVADGLKVQDATLKAGTDTKSIKDANSFGLVQVDSGTLTISETKQGKTGTLKWVGTYKAASNLDAATDKVCMYFFGYTIPKGAKCKYYAEGKTPDEQTLSEAKTDMYCQLTSKDTMYTIKDKKYTIECDKFTAPTKAQAELAFGVAFADETTSKCISASFHKLPATTGTAAPTRVPTAPTKAPTTKPFSAAPRSAVASGAAGFVSAVVAYFLF